MALPGQITWKSKRPIPDRLTDGLTRVSRLSAARGRHITIQSTGSSWSSYAWTVRQASMACAPDVRLWTHDAAPHCTSGTRLEMPTQKYLCPARSGNTPCGCTMFPGAVGRPRAEARRAASERKTNEMMSGSSGRAGLRDPLPADGCSQRAADRPLVGGAMEFLMCAQVGHGHCRGACVAAPIDAGGRKYVQRCPMRRTKTIHTTSGPGAFSVDITTRRSILWDGERPPEALSAEPRAVPPPGHGEGDWVHERSQLG